MVYDYYLKVKKIMLGRVIPFRGYEMKVTVMSAGRKPGDVDVIIFLKDVTPHRDRPPGYFPYIYRYFQTYFGLEVNIKFEYISEKTTESKSSW